MLNELLRYVFHALYIYICRRQLAKEWLYYMYNTSINEDGSGVEVVSACIAL